MPANFTGSLAISGSLILTGSITTTGGITISGSIDSASFAATASSADNFFVRQNLTASSALFTGSITAQTLVVQTVTSSIVYSSGSNIFGNLASNVQQFTGSLRVSGSGVHYIQGGCFGIGLDTPTNRLTVDSSGYPLLVSNDTGNRRVYIGTEVNGEPAIQATLSNGTVRQLVLQPAGSNVGIGTSNPTSILHVSQSGTNIATFEGATEAPYIQVRGTSSPYIQFLSGSTEVGYLQGANNGLSLGWGGSPKLSISGSGNVGIGTTSPTYKLQVADAGVPAVGIYRDLDVVSVGTAGQFIEFGARCGATFIPGAAIAGALDNPSTTGLLAFQTRCNNSLTTKMTISACGNIGIGTTNPVTNLHIAKGTNGQSGLQVTNSTTGATLLDGAFYGIDDNQAYVWNYENNPLVFATSGSERLRITCRGEVLVNTTTSLYGITNRGTLEVNGSTSVIALNISDAQGGYLYHDATDLALVNVKNGATIFYTNNAERMRITSTGIACFASQICAPTVIGTVSSITYPTLHGIKTFETGPTSAYNINLPVEFPNLLLTAGNVWGVIGKATFFNGGAGEVRDFYIVRNSGGSWSAANYGPSSCTACGILQSVTGTCGCITINMNTNSYVTVELTAMVR